MVIYLTRFFLGVMIIYAGHVLAEDLRDPTMPPLYAGEYADLLAQEGDPVLQSITLSSPTKFAIIDGETVMLGQRFQQYRLVKLTSSGAELRDSDGSLLQLKMDFQIEKKLLSRH